jgi:Flp pilus assembly pilin Flp
VTHPHPTIAPDPTPGAGPFQATLALAHRLGAEDSGQDMIEYALVASFMGLASVAGINGIASKIASDLTLVLNGFNAAVAPHS